MQLSHDDLEITNWPPQPQGGMLAGAMPLGVRVSHRPTGCAVECSYHRSQYKNREAAIAVLELLIDEA